MIDEKVKLLSLMKTKICKKEREFKVRNDRDYLIDLLEIGLSVEEAWQQILELNINFYINDSKPSYHKSPNSLTFKKNINGINVYIKLVLEDEKVVCWSFHKDERG